MVKHIIEKNELALAGGKELQVLKQFFPQCFTVEGEFDMVRFKITTDMDKDSPYALPKNSKTQVKSKKDDWLGRLFRLRYREEREEIYIEEEQDNEKDWQYEW